MCLKTLYLSFFFSFFVVSVYSQKYTAEKASVELKGKTVLGVKSSKTEHVESNLNLQKKQISFRIPVKNLSTGNKRENEKLMAVLEAEQYPYAEFTGKFKKFVLSEQRTQKVDLKGKILLHGEEQKVRVVATLTPVENGIIFRADLPIYFSDFEMERPKSGLFKEKDKHFITIHATFLKASKLLTNN